MLLNKYRTIHIGVCLFSVNNEGGYFGTAVTFLPYLDFVRKFS